MCCFHVYVHLNGCTYSRNKSCVEKSGGIYVLNDLSIHESYDRRLSHDTCVKLLDVIFIMKYYYHNVIDYVN